MAQALPALQTEVQRGGLAKLMATAEHKKKPRMTL